MIGKLAFVDHSFHRKSTATFFLMDLLRRAYEVDVFWDESWAHGPRADLQVIAKGGYDVVLFFQLIDRYSPDEIRHCGFRNVVLAPMYDQSGGWTDHFWQKYRHFKVLNFSRTLHDRLSALGMNSRHFQYFLPPAAEPAGEGDDGLRGFLWQRTSDVTWKHVCNLMGETSFQSFHLHLAVDPPGYGPVTPSAEDSRKNAITISNWFEKREDYFAALNRANVFFSPRRYEGIGMSFLEALARGMVVVAPDCPTMNEYIRHGVNGLLYNPSSLRPLDFAAIEALRRGARASAAEGHARWRKQETQLLAFIEEEQKAGRRIAPLVQVGNVLAAAASFPRRAWKKLKRTLG